MIQKYRPNSFTGFFYPMRRLYKNKPEKNGKLCINTFPFRKSLTLKYHYVKSELTAFKITLNFIMTKAS
ncbi:MAG TPA: hypothetical protein DCK76_09625 [Desulfotomaculum sp.]|nr:hypothetical protein [Desulfotomaculum sp.]HBY04767.1 hypothetical protein [Desulfotomaculum sp.]